MQPTINIELNTDNIEKCFLYLIDEKEEVLRVLAQIRNLKHQAELLKVCSLIH